MCPLSLSPPSSSFSLLATPAFSLPWQAARAGAAAGGDGGERRRRGSGGGRHWIGDGGLGNRILAAASAFLYAVLTARVLLVDTSNEMDELFSEPFPGTAWLLLRDFPLVLMRKTHTGLEGS
uniref:Fucosyltransferase n=1 Tax=Oryza sativa subsp. japonica TaxID=39947 RepID=Q10DW7_ORYSJ|nr:hypothetical protein LOC_Os03g50800 [Oryza sativa Japonica Group]